MSATNESRRSALLLAAAGAFRPPSKNQNVFDRGLSKRIRLIPRREIHKDPSQPRQSMDDENLDRLADTVRAFGILSPIVVSPREEGGYTIVLGERRFRAAERASLAEIPTIETGVLEERERLELQLLENLGREDLNIIEEGRAYARLVELGASQKEIARKVARSEASISRALIIADKLKTDWLELALQKKSLQSPSKLYEIAQAPESLREGLWNRFVLGITRKDLERHRPPKSRCVDSNLKRDARRLLKELRSCSRGSPTLGPTYGSLVAFALRHLLDNWNASLAEAFLQQTSVADVAAA